MKKSKTKLRSLVREHLQKNILTEKFGSRLVQNLHTKTNSGGRWSKSMISKLSKQYDIAWDIVTDDAVGNVANAGNKIINFFFVNQTKNNPFKGNSWHGTVYKGLIGVTVGKKVAGYAQSLFKWSVDKDNRGYDALSTGVKASDRAGNKIAGIHNFKRYREVADEVITIDLDKITGTAADKIENRKQAKAGATALMQAKDVLQQNKNRYDEILTKRHEGAGLESVEKMLDEAYTIFQSALADDIATLKSGFYVNSWRGRFEEAKNLYGRMVDEYKRFVEFAAEEKKSAAKEKKSAANNVAHDEWNERAYYAEKLPVISRSMQQYLQDFKSKMKKTNTDRKIPIVRQR